MDFDSEWASSNARKHIKMLYEKVEKVDAENMQLRRELLAERKLTSGLKRLMLKFRDDKHTVRPELRELELFIGFRHLCQRAAGTAAAGLV